MASSQLLELPPELRNKIWKYTVYSPTQAIQFWGPEPAITQVCRQTRAETRLMHFAMNTFAVSLYPGNSTMNQDFDQFHQSRLLKWLSCIGHEARSNIKQLSFNVDMRELSVSAEHYASLFELLGWHPQFSGLKTTAIVATILPRPISDPNRTFTADAQISMQQGREASNRPAVQRQFLRISAHVFTTESFLVYPYLREATETAMHLDAFDTSLDALELAYYSFMDGLRLCWYYATASWREFEHDASKYNPAIRRTISEAIASALEATGITSIWSHTRALMKVLKAMCYAPFWIVMHAPKLICIAAYLLHLWVRTAGPRVLFALAGMVMAILWWVELRHL